MGDGKNSVKDLSWAADTYTFATGTTNGTFSVTPSGGSIENIAIYGLQSAAYKNAEDFASMTSVQELANEITNFGNLAKSNFIKTKTDPGQGSPLAENDFIFVYEE